MKIVFFGTPEFAVESLDSLVKAGHDVAAVVTATDKPAGRGHAMLQSAVKQYALSRGIPVLQPEKLRDETFLEQLRAIGADLFVVIAFRMMPEVVWAMPPLGTFNLHASLLPKYRGAAPINRAVINGDTRSGVTTFFLTHEIDTGDIIDRREVEIGPDDTAGDLHDRLMHLGAELTVKTVAALEAGQAVTTPQSALTDQIQPSPAPKIHAETCRIDVSAPAQTVHNLVRGLSPFPGARARLTAANLAPQDLKVLRTRLAGTVAEAPAGTLLEGSGGEPLLVCGDGRAVELVTVQAPGKRRMGGAEWLRGARPVEPRLS